MMTGFQFLSLVFGPLPVKLIGIQKTLPREIKPTEYEKIFYNDDASQSECRVYDLKRKVGLTDSCVQNLLL